MSKLFLLTLIAIGLIALVGTIRAARFDWSLGQPAITADNTLSGTTTDKFDWSLGVPTVMSSSTAAAEAPAVAEPEPQVIIIDFLFKPTKG